MKILLHSSKTMKPEISNIHELTTPLFINEATNINALLRKLNKIQVANLMGISEAMAIKVKQQVDDWVSSAAGSPTALTFRGDIYSGLAAASWNKADARFAQKHLLILSGLYGLLRPFDEIKPYRLEMDYKLKLAGVTLDKFWVEKLGRNLDVYDVYVNLTSNEYFKIIKSQLGDSRVVSPKFLTVSPKTNAPVFVTVHAKIARGSFANWLITNKIDDIKQISSYDQLNYQYDKSLSTAEQPVFVCRKFGGLGLSVRLI